MDAIIRSYQSGDEAVVAELWHRTGRATYGFLPSWQSFGADEARRVFRQVIARDCKLWVAERDGRVVAFRALKDSYVDRLYVDPSEQRLGWGTRLLDHARSLHPGGLSLHTHQENQVARALYEKRGFVAVRFGTSPPPECAPDVEYRWPAFPFSDTGPAADLRSSGERGSTSMSVEILGLDHVYLSVRSLRASERFYDLVMEVFGFRKVEEPLHGEPHIHYYGRQFGFTLRPARPGTANHDCYAPGLHHLCFRVTDEAAVDATACALRAAGIPVSEPRRYPEYSPDYYAAFFSDVDDIRLELCNFWEVRRRRMLSWEETGIPD